MLATDSTTSNLLEQLVKDRILHLDGGMGTMLQRHKPTEKDWRGEQFANHSTDLTNCSDVLNLTQPDWIRDIHTQYLEAGADIIETNSFLGTRIGLADNALQDYARETNLAAARLAREAVDAMNKKTPDKPRFVAGSIGPLNKFLSIGTDEENPALRKVTFDQVVETYYEQISTLVEGGVDILLAETAIDTANLKACLFAAEKFFEDSGQALPLMASLSFLN
ncbi:MAG: homocysteine S-methyltransferase family protein, partial [Planctomycetales bacterium]